MEICLCKKCNTCGETKPLELFNRNSKSKDGFVSSCKDCKSKYRKQNADKISRQKEKWYALNKEYVHEKNKAARQSSPEKHKEADCRRYAKHRDKILKRVSVYQKEHPEVNRKASKKYRDANLHKGAAKTAKRRSRLKQATPTWSVNDEWEQFFISEIYHLCELSTKLLCREFHVDHQVPITSKKVCGLHVSSNLQILTSYENVAKLNRWWPDMWTEDFVPTNRE